MSFTEQIITIAAVVAGTIGYMLLVQYVFV